MGATFDVHNVTNNIGLTAGTANTPLFVNPTENGCITVTNAYIWSGGAGPVTATLVYGDVTGGTVNGTICVLGSAAQVFAAAGTAALAKSSTISGAVVPPGKAVIVQLGAGTAGTDTVVSVSYVKGQ